MDALTISIIIILVLFVICIICSICSDRLQYYIVSYVFANIAPVSEGDEERKKVTDRLHEIKSSLEDRIKRDYSNDSALNKIDTYNYEDIKDELTKDMFDELTDNCTKPILIKNVLTNKDLSKFNFKHMGEKYGDIVVEALKYVKDGVEPLKVPFSEFLEKISNGEKYYLTINNSLANVLDKDKFMHFYKKTMDSLEGFTNIFIGNKGSFTHLHSEISASCALQLNGIKKWYLIDPKYSEYLNPIPDKNKIFSMSVRGFNNPDSIIENIPRYDIICEAGDFLYVPPWWWHETSNLTDENIMFSYRPPLFTAPYKTNTMNTLMGMKISLGFNKLVYPLLVKGGFIDPNEDTVISSIKEIRSRVPEKYRRNIKI